MMRSQVCTRILIASVLVWFVILLFVARHLSSLKSNGGENENNKDAIVKNRIDEALAKLTVLQRHNHELKSLLNDLTDV